MLLGILSDSHGRAAITAQAVSALVDRGADVLLHLGDVETEAVIDELVGHNARVVFGNCDWNVEALGGYARLVSVGVDHPMGFLEVGGRRIAYTHGHLTAMVNRALAEEVDYLLHGHTHETRDERVGATRIINPGALHRASRYTCALLDPCSDSLDWIEIAHLPPVRRHG